MDIAAMSMSLNQTSVESAVSTEVLKMTMNNSTKIATQMTDMMSNMAVDTNVGTVIDARV